VAGNAKRDVEILKATCHYLINGHRRGVSSFLPGKLGLALWMLQGGATFYPVRYFSMALGTDSLEMIPGGVPILIPPYLRK